MSIAHWTTTGAISPPHPTPLERIRSTTRAADLLLALIFIAVAGFVYRWIESAPAGPGAPPSPIGGMVLSLSSLLVSLATLGFVRYQAAIAMRQMEQLERADANTRELILAFSLDSGHVRERAL